MAFDMNPKANTYPDIAKNQHLVPKTYMRNGVLQVMIQYGYMIKWRKIKEFNLKMLRQ